MTEQIKFYENKLAYEMDPSDLFAALNNGDKIIVIDARQSSGFELEHIPGSLNLPHRTMNEETTGQLDRNLIYVTYCDGIGCNASTKGALNLARLGFQVKELIGGLEWWKKDGYATEGSNAKKDGLQITCAC